MLVRNALLLAARQQWLRRWVERSPVARLLTRRFVAGETLEEGLAVCAKLNREGILATLDHLGENVTSAEEAAASRDAYLAALDAIAARGLQATVSIKLTHFGLDFSEPACRDYVTAVVRRARERGNAVEVDMESSGYVDRTLRLVMDLHEIFGCVRAVIQAYLRRSERDLKMLLERGIPVRLCKGAYREPASIALVRRRDINANYVRLARLLLAGGVQPAFATHDERMIAEVIRMAGERGMNPDHLEFQMLYGVRRSLQQRLARQGFRVRLYVPYGVAWYPYLMRRLAERPANLLFLLKNLVRR
jgi:proline dehydrogenase